MKKYLFYLIATAFTMVQGMQVLDFCHCIMDRKNTIYFHESLSKFKKKNMVNMKKVVVSEVTIKFLYLIHLSIQSLVWPISIS